MTERLAETTRRIRSVHQLDAVVAAMRGISASRVQQAHALLHGVRAHTAIVARAIGQALPLVPDSQDAGTARAGRPCETETRREIKTVAEVSLIFVAQTET